MTPALNQIVVIFFAIAVGFLCRKRSVLTEASTAMLSNLVIKVALPFYLFGSIISSNIGISNQDMLTAIELSLLFFLVCGLIAIGTVMLLYTPKEDAGVYMFELLCSNTTYMGIPICAAALGGAAAFYASILCIVYNLVCFSLGLFLLVGKVSLRHILNPPFLVGTLATILYAGKIPVPEVLVNAASFIGQSTSPCAMLVIGSVLAAVPLRNMFNEWRAVPYLLIRLFGAAAAIAFLLCFLPVDPNLKGMLIVMAAMPAATNSTMLCTIYGGNRALSAKLIFLSTALSALTIPLWIRWIELYIM